MPEWASTHPEPASRVRAALAQAGSDPNGITNRETFLTRVNGVVYGDDPEQGVVDGRVFTHPGLRLHFEAPAGYCLVNGAQAVAGRMAYSDAQLDRFLVFNGLNSDARLVPGQLVKLVFY